MNQFDEFLHLEKFPKLLHNICMHVGICLHCLNVHNVGKKTAILREINLHYIM